MLKYGHVINDFGSGREIQYVDGARSPVDSYGKDQGTGGADHPEPVYLAHRREVLKSVPKNGAKAGSEAEEKKSLKRICDTYIILLLTKEAVL